MKYVYRDGVSGCVSDGRVVLLDIVQDQFLSLGSAADATMKQILAGLDVRENDVVPLRKLIERGLLVNTGESIKMSDETILPVPVRNLERETHSPAISVLALAIIAQFRVTRHLQKRSLKCVLDDLARDKNGHSVAKTLPEEVQTVARAFVYSGRFFSTQDKCLPRSIALAKCLSRRGYPVNFVIGVRMKPFGAHAWVQWDDIVLNDSIDNVRPYTSILVI